MDNRIRMTVAEMNHLLREIGDASDPGEPLRRKGIEMGDLTDAHCPDRRDDRRDAWNPYERCLRRILRVDHRSPGSAYDSLYALLSLIDDLSGPDATMLTVIGPTGLRRLLIALVLTVRLMEATPSLLSELLPV